MTAQTTEPIDRLYGYFGWQGGTIHMLAKETGLPAEELLSMRRPENTGVINEPFIAGISGLATCDVTWRRDRQGAIV